MKMCRKQLGVRLIYITVASKHPNSLEIQDFKARTFFVRNPNLGHCITKTNVILIHLNCILKLCILVTYFPPTTLF